MKTASFHSDAVTFKATAIVVDDLENADPSKDSFVSLDVLTAVYRRDNQPARLFSFNIDPEVAEELVRRLQRALAEIPKTKPPKPHVVRGPYA
jgi:hypothetical protein